MTLRDRTVPSRHHERTPTMGASRDFTTGSDYPGQGTALLERGRRTTPLPSRSLHRGTVPSRRKLDSLGGSRLGSKQVVSNRGRRVVHKPKSNALISRLSVIAVTLIIVGVAGALWLSGLSTSQTFKIQQLSAQDSTLDNQLETLNRDLENVRSASDVARRAHDAKMGIPVQPGIVEVNGEGKVEEKREATPEMDSVIDVNGKPVRPGRASSDPNATADMSENLNARPNPANGLPHRDGGGDIASDAERENPEVPAPVEDAVELPNIPAPAPYAARG